MPVASRPVGAECVLAQAELANSDMRRRLLKAAGKLLFRARWVSRRYINQWPRYQNARARWFWLLGREKEAEKTWLAAHAIFLKKNSVWGQAMVLMDWGSALHTKDPARARPLLKNAWPLVVARLGSKSDLERLQKLLPESQSKSLSLSGSHSSSVSRDSHGEWVGAERLATLAEVSSKMSSTLEADRLLEEVVSAAAHIFGAERAFLFLIDPVSQEMVRKAAFQPSEDIGHERLYSATMVVEVLRKGAGVACADAQSDRISSDSIAAAGILSLMCVPLRFQNNLLGALYLDNRLVKGLFGAEDLKILEAFASQAAVAIVNAQLFSSQNRSRQELASLYDTSKELIGVLDRRQIYSALLARARSITGATSAAVILYEEGHPEVRLQQHFPPESLKEIIDFLSAVPLQELQALPLADGTMARLAPLAAQGKPEGVLAVANVKEPERAGELLAHIAAQGTLALSNSRLYELAIMDELTLLYQRRYFDMMLNDLVEKKEAFAIIMIDLNDFKTINDTRSHAVGDAVLKQVGQTIRRSLRAGDLPARIGGDEFAVLLPKDRGTDTPLVVEKLRAAIAAIRIEEPGKPPPKVWASFGYASSLEGPPVHVKILADERLYEDKKKSKGK